ncbi:MAG TPA: efflux RND transporter permease subunit [Verrucomicrobiae bacterium]|nr:efflux RND transporter permease subunit [Verrucomicrobiae bacterium]
MNLTGSFIYRPVMTTLLMAAILIFGVMAYRSLPVADMPTVDFPTIVVTANLPGASPETMASSVATPLEKQFSTIQGIESMNSVSTLGRTQVTLQFSLSRNIDAAAQDVQAQIARTLRDLPQNMPNPPSYRKTNPADAPVLQLAVFSDTLPLSDVDEYAENVLAQRISMVSGVSQVDVFGSQKRAVRIQLDPTALSYRQIGIDEVLTAVQRGNVDLPLGTLNGPQRAYTLKSNGQLLKAEDYQPLVVTYRNGVPVMLKDIGRVIESVENDKVAAWYNNRPAVVLAVNRQPGANVVEVVDGVKAILPGLRGYIPPSVNLEISFDRTLSIRESIWDVQFTLGLTVALVVLVIFLFLRNLSATIIPSLALPMSIIGTFAVMYLLGYSMNNLSLMALTLSVGFVVDDAIVVLENIVRHVEEGQKVFDAALDGAKEIAFTILSMTFSLVAAFIPVLFMSGMLGRLLREFSVTICVAILVSGLVSLSLTPMLCSRFLKPAGAERHGRIYTFVGRFFDSMLKVYDWTLQLALKARLTTLAVSFALLAATGYFFMVVPKGFIPSEDTNQILINTESAQGTSFYQMMRLQKQLNAIVTANPNVDGFRSSVGVGGQSQTGNAGQMFIRLKLKKNRPPVARPVMLPFTNIVLFNTHEPLSADEIIQELRPKLSAIPGIRVSLQNPPVIRLEARLSRSLYQFTMMSPDNNELYQYAPLLEEKIRASDKFQDVNSDLQLKSPQLEVVVDREKASILGITQQGLSARQIQEAFYDAYGSRQISTINTPTNQYQVIMELDPKYVDDPSVLSLLYIRSNTGGNTAATALASGTALIPLNSVATLKHSVGPQSVNHSGQLPSVTISFNLKPGVALSDGLNEIGALARQTLPPTIATAFQGTAEKFQSSLSSMWFLLLMAIVVVYLVLGILYESFVHPLTILSGLPSAGLGALLTLMLFGMDLNVYGFVGIIMLIGIVKKNAIMMIDFAIEGQRKEGKSAFQAIYEGCLVRFRPIMMTTMAAIMGALPIALGHGAGAESRRPLGLAVVGGLLVSQLLTLYITPVVYLYFEAAAEKARSWRRHRREPEAAHAPAPAWQMGAGAEAPSLWHSFRKLGLRRK